MKISIWQQFSSNHSADFVIVGKFHTPETAEEAAQKLRGLLAEVTEWYRSNADAVEESAMDTGFIPLSEPEREFSTTYSADFGDKSLIYWGFLPIISWKQSEEVVRVGEHVLLSPHAEAAMDDPRPLKGLMAGLGSNDTYVQLDAGDAYMWEIRVHLTCLPPDEETAQAIFDQVAAYLNPAAFTSIGTTSWGWGTSTGGSAWGEVRLDGRQLIFDVVLDNPNSGLPALITHLEANDCKDIDFTMEEVSMWEGLD
jgi:hypothetical protein